MKTMKILLFLAVFSAVTFYSCSDSDPIENKNLVVPQKSIALRTTLNELKKANDISGKPAKTDSKVQARTATNPFCFNFVYPLTLSLSNNTTITITSLEGLLDVLGSESPSLYVVGIGFPFQVTYGGAVHTIAGEGQFIALLQYCGYHTLNFDLSQTSCFEFVYPLNIKISFDQILEVNNNQELQDYINQNNNYGVDFLYPVSVNYGGEIVVINNIYEMYEMINNCDSCICTLEYAPVCVQTANGIIEYSNMCFAQCAGFTQNDLVPCNPNNQCSIYDFQITPGACNNATYQLTINFSYVNVSDTQFWVYTSTGQNLGSYPLSALPITINNYPLSMATIDNLVVQIGNCTGTATWSTPNCGCVCPTNFDPVCVQTATGIVQYDNACLAECAGHLPSNFITCGVAPNNFGTQLGSCFQINYPVQVMSQGQVVTINNNGELLQYWFPVQSPIPYMVYPITATFGNQVMTFANAAAFQAQIAASCN
jgi:hypothetical protein